MIAFTRKTVRTAKVEKERSSASTARSPWRDRSTTSRSSACWRSRTSVPSTRRSPPIRSSRRLSGDSPSEIRCTGADLDAVERAMRGTWVLGLLILLACDSNDPSKDAGKDSGADAGQDGGQDSGTNDYGELPTDPILERTPDLQYDCAQKLAVTRQVGRSWNGYGSTFSVIESGGGFLFGRVERAGDPFAPPTSVDAFL